MFSKATRTCKNFQKQTTELRKVLDQKVSFATSSYAGDYQTEQISKATEEFNSGYTKVRQEYITKATETLSSMRDAVKRKIGTVNGNALASINQLRGMKLSKAEIEALFEHNSKDYYALKAIASLAAENGFKVGELPVDSMIYAIDKLEDRLSKFASYDGSNQFIGHAVNEITQLENPFADIETEFSKLNAGGVIEITANEQKPEVSPEQLTVVKGMFDNSKDKFATAEYMIKIGMGELIQGTEFEVFMPSEVE